MHILYLGSISYSSESIVLVFTHHYCRHLQCIECIYVYSSTVAPILTITESPKNVSVGQPATVVISINALPAQLLSVSVSLPSTNAQPPNISVNESSSIAVINFSSVSRSNNGTYTVTATLDIGSRKIDFQLLVYC